MSENTPVVTDGSYRVPITHEEYDRVAKEVATLQRARAQQLKRLEHVLAAFLRYGRHEDDCDGGDDHCSCGYTSTWRRCLQLEAL